MNPEETMRRMDWENRLAAGTKTPDAVEAAEVSAFATHADPSQKTRLMEAAKRVPGRGIEWVRPADLMTRAGSHVAGRGIDFQAELARRTRTLGIQRTPYSRTGIDKRSYQLPPVSAFGRSRNVPQFPSASRSGMGLG